MCVEGSGWRFQICVGCECGSAACQSGRKMSWCLSGLNRNWKLWMEAHCIRLGSCMIQSWLFLFVLDSYFGKWNARQMRGAVANHDRKHVFSAPSFN